jgi:hypothetical protein
MEMIPPPLKGIYFMGTRLGVFIAAPNNGMHPTADTKALMLRQGCGAAGDAGR